MDKERIKYEIKKKEYKRLSDFCAEIGMSTSAFYRKLNGTSSFTLKEMIIISNKLGYETPNELFYSNSSSL